jgi:hypothetical protein
VNLGRTPDADVSGMSGFTDAPEATDDHDGGKMRTSRISAITVLVFAGATLLSTPAQAAPPPKFKNCTEMHKRYVGGVGKPGAVDKRRSGHAKYAPYRNTATYNANVKMDADHDGIACEQ